MKRKQVELPCVIRHWGFKDGLAKFLAPSEKEGVYTLCAQQIVSPEDAMARAEIIVCDDESVLFTDTVSLPMPIGKDMLLQQVYWLSQIPLYSHAEWQFLLRDFCLSDPNFILPVELWQES